MNTMQSRGRSTRGKRKAISLECRMWRRHIAARSSAYLLLRPTIGDDPHAQWTTRHKYTREQTHPRPLGSRQSLDVSHGRLPHSCSQHTASGRLVVGWLSLVRAQGTGDTERCSFVCLFVLFVYLCLFVCFL